MASIATRDAYGEALAELGAVNENIVVLEADLSKSTKTSDFKKVYPERHFNMGIAEQNMLGVAAGFVKTIAFENNCIYYYFRSSGCPHPLAASISISRCEKPILFGRITNPYAKLRRIDISAVTETVKFNSGYCQQRAIAAVI